MAKFYNVDPESCSKEELEAAIRSCKLAEDDYNNKQLSSKIFINSIYGALANKFYYNSNIDMAESITLQGQDLIKYSVRVVNYYFAKLWPEDEVAHKKIAEYMKQKFPDFDTEKFMDFAKRPVQFGDTLQIYGDSVTGDSLIHLSTGEYVTIEELFNAECKSDSEDKIRVTSDKMIWSFDSTACISKIYPVKYIMRHKTNHNIWKIVTSSGNVIKVTNDHSIPILYDGILVNTKTEEIPVGADVICFDSKNNISSIEKIVEKVDLGNIAAFVYDIEVDSEIENEHYFFANNILVHNTDSVSKTSIIRTSKHPDGITIEDFYNENINNIGDTTLLGHESVNTNDKVLNYTDSLNYNNVKRIIRHKVAKKKWRITTESGKTIECTDNHSLIVFRNGEKIKVKPSEIISTDSVLCIDNLLANNNLISKFEKITQCECIGEYTEDEYVYDIEMDDDSHTFIANDILVHNSAYISLQPVIDSCNIPIEQETDFVLAVNEGVLAEYLEQMFERYAADFNCPKNLEKFELEKIARSVIMLAKKKYIMDISWKEPDVHVAPLHTLVYKGIEVIQGSTPDFCRECMKDFIKFMLEKIDAGQKPEYDAIIRKLKEIKTKFSMQNPNEISKSFGMSDYEKYILDDKKEIKFVPDVVCPIHVRAAAVYNNLLYTKAKKYKSKYNIIHKGDKVKFYYTADNGVFAFLPNDFPGEFAPKMDIDLQFEKMVLEPLNRIIEASGYPKVSSSLTFSVGLW